MFAGAESAEVQAGRLPPALGGSGEESTWVVEPLQGEHEVIRSVSPGKSMASASPGTNCTVVPSQSSLTHSSISRHKSFSSRASGCKVWRRGYESSFPFRSQTLRHGGNVCVWFLYELHHLLGDLLLHAGLPGYRYSALAKRAAISCLSIGFSGLSIGLAGNV